MDEAAKKIALDELAHRVVTPYIIISIVLVILAVCVYYSALPDMHDEGESSADAPPAIAPGVC